MVSASPRVSAATHLSAYLRVSSFSNCVRKRRVNTHPLPVVSEVTLLSTAQSSPIVFGSTAPKRILFQRWLKSPRVSAVTLLSAFNLPRLSIFSNCVWKHAPTRIFFQWCLKSPCSPQINLRQLCLEAPRQRASSSNGVYATSRVCSHFAFRVSIFQWCLKSPCFPHINLRQLCLEAAVGDSIPSSLVGNLQQDCR